MVQVSLEACTIDHVKHVAANMRRADRDEIWAATMHSPMDALMHGYRYSDIVVAGCYDGVPVCIYGIGSDSLIFNLGVIWLLGTDAIDENPIPFLRRCRKGLMQIAEGYDKIENYVDARNEKTKMWLEWLGFEIHEPAPYGRFNLLFHRFTMENAECVI